jgi:hypothetical protein
VGGCKRFESCLWTVFGIRILSVTLLCSDNSVWSSRCAQEPAHQHTIYKLFYVKGSKLFIYPAWFACVCKQKLNGWTLESGFDFWTEPWWIHFGPTSMFQIIKWAEIFAHWPGNTPDTSRDQERNTNRGSTQVVGSLCIRSRLEYTMMEVREKKGKGNVMVAVGKTGSDFWTSLSIGVARSPTNIICIIRNWEA